MAKNSLIRIAKQIRGAGRALGTNRMTTKVAAAGTGLALSKIRTMKDGYRKGGRIRRRRRHHH